jgi:hypothetical protein
MMKKTLENLNPDPFLTQLKKSADYINQRRINGYIYEILCLRYKIARDAQARYEIDTCYDGNIKKALAVAKKEELDFCQMLDKVMGPHYF